MSLRGRIAGTAIIVTAVAFLVSGLVVFSLMRVSLTNELRQTMKAQVNLWVKTRRVPQQASLVLLSPSGLIYQQGTKFALPLGEINYYRSGFVQYQGHYVAWASSGATLMVVAQPLTSVARPLGRLRSLILVTDGASLVLLGLLSLWFSGRGLRPLRRVNRLASDISETGRLDLRIDTRNLPPEVSSLGTALNQMLDRVNGAFNELAETQTRERRLIADMSHDLRTPLHILEGNLEVLSHPALPAEERQGALADALSEARRMGGLVERLLLIARGELPVPAEAETVALPELVGETAERFRSRLEGRELRVDGAPEARVKADPQQLVRLVEILLDNAVKYTEPGHGTIAVKVWPEGRDVKLQVADNGIGISGEDMPHIFERFYRADRARNRDGFGLGLSLARHIVTAAGGSIGAESEPGMGATFTCSFPREAA